MVLIMIGLSLTSVSPSREEVCERMSRNIGEWNLNSPRNINYRSFKPILRLLLVSHTMVCRLWAAWALANLTTVYRKGPRPLKGKYLLCIILTVVLLPII